MSVIDIEDLRAKRKGHVDAMRTIQAAADNAERDLTGEEVGEFEKRENAYNAVSEDIARREKLEGFATDAASPVEENPAKRDSAPVVSNDPAEQSEIETRAFEKIVRNRGRADGLDKHERAALQVDTDSEGGYTVPKAFERTLIESKREFGVIDQLASHITTGDSGDLSIPTVATNSTGTWVAEEGPYQESEGTFGTVTLKAYKAAVIAKVSDELLHDSAFDILGWLAKDQGEALGKLTGTAYANAAANASTSPQGLVNLATVGKTGAANTAVTGGELMNMYHSIIGPYRQNAVWVMNDATVADVRGLTEAVNGQYLWQPGLQAGIPDTLLGRPLYTDTNVPVLTKNAPSFLFGDIASAYIIRDVEGITVKVLNELYAANGQVGFRASLRTDGKLRDAAAVRVYKGANV